MPRRQGSLSRMGFVRELVLHLSQIRLPGSQLLLASCFLSQGTLHHQAVQWLSIIRCFPARGSHGVRLRLLTQVATAPMIRVGSFLVVPDFRLMNHQYPAKILAKPGFIGEHSHFQDLPSSNHVSLWHFRIFPSKVPRLAIAETSRLLSYYPCVDCQATTQADGTCLVQLPGATPWISCGSRFFQGAGLAFCTSDANICDRPKALAYRSGFTSDPSVAVGT